MKAVYDLTKRPTTFDFAAWIINAKTMGATEVVFCCDGPIQAKKYSADIAKARLENILKPICDLARMEWSIGPLQDGIDPGYSAGDVERTFQQYGRIAKFEPLSSRERTGYITITVRESIRNKHRDSNRKEWERFAATVSKPVVWVEDADKRFISVADRMAIYAGADMNLGVSQGPFALLCFSDLPYCALNMIPEGDQGKALDKYMRACGFGSGSQFSFRHPWQKLFWMPDTCENIARAYLELAQECERHMVAAV